MKINDLTKTKVGNQNNPNLTFSLLISLIIIFRIWLIAGIPKMILAAPLDDLFFAKAGYNIIHGQWMGPYSQTTLIKGPFYALFLIFSFLTGLPLLINETIFYIAACILLIIAIRPLISSKWWRLFIYIVLSFSPASFPSQLNLRVYREFIYLSLTLFIIAFSVGLFLRLRQKSTHLLFWSIGLGLSTGAFLITREEGVWILPALIVLLLISVVILSKKRIDKWRIRIGVLLLSVLICYLPIIVVSSLNFYNYGFWGVAETLDPDLNRVLTTLQSIKVNDWHPAIQVSKAAIEKAYAVSPHFSELKTAIERSWSGYDYWDNITIGTKPSWYLNMYGNGKTEMSNGHFVWLLRDAVFSSGQIDTRKYPREYYKQLADQLEAACENRALDCYSSHSLPFVGNIDARHYPIIGRFLVENFSSLIRSNYLGGINLDINTWPVWPVNDSDYRYFEELIYNSTDTRTVLSGDKSVIYAGGRLKMMGYKEIIMKKVTSIYRVMTLPLFVISLIGYFLLSFFTVLKKQSYLMYTYWLIVTFLLGLLFSRLITLTIVDATTSMSAMGYGASMYIFVYLFISLMFYWIYVPGWQQLRLISRANRQFGAKTP